jgi:hypothetical protein
MTANGTLWNVGGVLPTLYPLNSGNVIVDVGGGEGSIIKQLLRYHPTFNGTLFDLVHLIPKLCSKILLPIHIQEHVVADAKADVHSYVDIQDRLTFVGGSFFDKIPFGGI